LVVRSRRVVTRDGVTPAALHIRGGRVIGVLDFENVPERCPLDDAGDLVVMPGAVDTHVHVNASAAADGHVFEQTTRAAAAGGICGGMAPGNSHELGRLAKEGVFGFACAFGSAAVDGAAAVTETDLRTAMPALTRIGAMLMVQGELPGPIERAVDGQNSSMGLFDRLTRSLRGGRKYIRFLETHPKEAETEAILQLL